MYVLTKAQITQAEEKAVLNGAFSFKSLMYNAGFKAFEKIKETCEIKNKKIAVLVGNGNNGGDGCVIARLLYEHCAQVCIITPFGIPKTENALFYYNGLGPIKKYKDFYDNNYDIIIDALFGIGFNREPDINTKNLFQSVNNAKGIKIAIDIPSGVVCDNGAVFETAFKADFTFTFISLKPCFLLPIGSDFCGKIEIIDIGVSPVKGDYEIIEKPHFQKRKHNSHKGTFGTALIIAGSYGMAGAAMLASKSALRSGLGIAKCLIPKSIYSPFTAFLPEAVCIPSDETEKGILNIENSELKKHMETCDAILFGCGLGQSKEIIKTVEYLVQNSTKPIIFDADGINALSKNIKILKKSKAPIILTPHPGEMARLCDVTTSQIEADRILYAKEFALKYNCTVVLKGSNTIVAENNGNISFNFLGNPGMATGGSGDVLAGITVSLLAQGFSPEKAAKSAVYLHSLAGDKAAQKRSQHAIIPTDIIDEL